MHVSVLTIFPEFFEGPLTTSIPARAIQAGSLRVDFASPRDFATNVHRTVDDTPYGGGAGMVMRAVEMEAALLEAQSRGDAPRHVVLMSPQGVRLDQEVVASLAQKPGLVIVCGRYEGIDERFIDAYVDQEISIGDFVLSGGEPAAFIVIDAVARLLDGVVGNAASIVEESFSEGTIEHPHFTRPLAFRGEEVPEILRSGDHGKIAKWRRKVSLLRTQHRRPDLWDALTLSKADRKLLEDPRIFVDPRWYENQRSRKGACPELNPISADEATLVDAPEIEDGDSTN